MINRFNEKEMTGQELADCKRFTWNSSVNENQIERMNALRQKGQELCELFIANTPNSADRSAAIRYLRLAVMQCNIAIAHENMK